MAPESKTNVPIILGAMTLGNGPEQSRMSDLDECGEFPDLFALHGHKEVYTAHLYGSGSSETYLGLLNWQSRRLEVSTKLYPTAGKMIDGTSWTHSAADLDKGLTLSLSALKAETVDIYYLHGLDRDTPFEDTLAGIDALYKQGKFRRFGISNYQAWEVARICELCAANGWIKPSIYQGVYNAVQRSVEPELFPCLRHYGLAFYAYNPLAGGFFTGRVTKDTEIEEGSRFDSSKLMGRMYRARYWNEEYFAALDIVKPVSEKCGLSLTETALRWETQHSLLKRGYGDSILIGASSKKQLEENLAGLEKGPLPEELISALDEAWAEVRGIAGKYWH